MRRGFERTSVWIFDLDNTLYPAECNLFAQVDKRMRLPGFASEAAWVVDKTLQGLGLYHQKIHVLSEMNKTIACSVEKAKAELGYRPVVGLEEGMRRSLRWVWERQGGLD